jgi:hypothetical protein
VDGPQAGASTISNDVGRFTFAGTFEVGTTVRVSKEGYTSATETARSNGSSNAIWAFVLLDALARPVDLVGNYTLTIVADSACTGIPDDVRTRSYSASIGITPHSDTQSGTSLMITASGAPFASIHDGFPIGVAGGDVAFAISAGEDDFGLVEKIAPGTFLAIGGFGRVSVGTGPIARIATPFSGSIDYCALQSDTAWTYECNNRTAFVHCGSTQHQLILSRR